MNFLAPVAFGFLIALPVVILIYLLKRKRTVKLVSSTLLWQKFLAETQASAPFQKLRKNWLLLLQLLLLCLAILALARPYFAAKRAPSELRVVILDGSASMQATDESPSRFEKARAEALRWVDTLAGNDQMVVLVAGANTEVKQSASSEKAALRRALHDCEPSDSPTRLVPALRMAESLVRDRPGAEVHLFSDGAVSGLDELENKALPLVFHKLGLRSDNRGIVALDVRAHPEDPRQRAVYVSVANSATNSVSTEVELSLDGELLETRPITIPAGESSPQVFMVSQKKDGIFSVRLTGEDLLAADNQAWIVSTLPRPAKALLITPGNRFLERALRACPNLELSVSSSLTDSAKAFDFVVLDGITPAVWPEKNIMAINVANPNWMVEAQSLEAPPIVDWRSAHPLLRYVGFDNVQIIHGRVTKPPAWAVSLVDAPQASLAVAGELGRQRLIWIGFDTLESNWPLRVSFPIFVANAAEWLNPANEIGGQLLVKAGEPFRLPLLQPERSAEVRLPDGKVVPVSLDEKSTELVFGQTARRGVYRVKLGGSETAFAANLLDSSESNITPQDELKLGRYTKVQATTMQRANMELWRGIAGLALLALLFEWWYYHRRTV